MAGATVGNVRPMNPYANDQRAYGNRQPQGMQSNTPDQGLRQYSENLANDVASRYSNVPKGVNGKRKRGGRKGMLPTDAKSGGMIAKPMPSKVKKPGNPMGAILGVTKAAPSPVREPGVRKRMIKEEEK